jgi:hypothetical protein
MVGVRREEVIDHIGCYILGIYTTGEHNGHSCIA